MRGSVFLWVVMLAGCGADERAGNGATATDINAAAEAAQGDIDTYAANTLAIAPAPTPVAKAPVSKIETASVPPRPSASRAAAQPIDGPVPVVRCTDQTRVSARNDDAPADVRAPAPSRTARIWTAGEGRELRSDRSVAERPAPIECAVN